MLRPSLAAAAVVAVLVSGVLLMTRPDQPAVGEPSPSLPGVVAPSPTPIATTPTAPGFPRPTGVWIVTGSMGTHRSGHTAVRLVDGRVLVVGGSGGESDPSTAELYDPESGTWSVTGSMLRPHAGFPATLLRDGKVLVGDANDLAADSPVLGAEVYDPATGTWSATGPMVKPDGGSAVLLRDGRVLVVHSFGKSELYDPDSGTWTATGQMLAYFHQSFTSVLMADGKVLVAGGGDGMRYAGEGAELYDPESGAWTAIANMNGRKEVISATLLGDGTVLVMGNGFIYPMPPELYDPAFGTWTVVGDAHDCCRLATLLPDGMVLMAGRGDALDAELYHPGTGSWTATGSMLQPHGGAPATLLLDGTVLVAGGDSGSAELYVPAGVTPPSGLPTAAPIPIPTPTPIPTPIPTPYPPQAGPVPPGARSLKLTVVNRSDQPATLFVADEDERGTMARLAGNVTPHVVPPGATVQVTLLVPAKGVDGWSIWVNPGPDLGGLVGWTDLSTGGEIHIGPEGQVGWLPKDQLPRP